MILTKTVCIMYQTVDFKGHILQFSGFVWHESDVSFFNTSKFLMNLTQLYLADSNCLILKEPYYYLFVGKAEGEG